MSVDGRDMVRLTVVGTLAHRLTSTTFDHCPLTELLSGATLAYGHRSRFVAFVGVVVGVGVCTVSVAVLGETDSTATCQL